MTTVKTLHQGPPSGGEEVAPLAANHGINLQENLRFLVLRVTGLVDDTLEFIGKPTPARLNTILNTDDYIDNLKSTIESICFSYITAAINPEKKEVDRIRASQTICINLERIADFCTNIARQQGYLHDPSFPGQFPYPEMFREARKSLGNILPVLQKMNLGGALAICRSEFELDRLYKENFDAIRERLRSSREEMDDLLTMLFIFRYLERIGDSILNIGESLLLAILGERIKIHQFQALQNTLSKSGFNGSLTEVGIRPIMGTRSGCRISRVAIGDDADANASRFQDSIFKEGNPAKIRNEMENIKRWHTLFPGLAPRVFSYHEEGGTASMLEEFLPGCPLDTVVLSSPMEVLDSAIFVLEATLRDIWSHTIRDTPQQSNYLGQIQSRLPDILRVHPAFLHGEKKVGSHLVPSVKGLLETCSRIEQEHFQIPFTVLIHGDFNLNNVLYHHPDTRVYYIDFNRSRQDDYIKDISVMLISNFRLPVFDPAIRERLNWVMESLYRFALEFAQDREDRLFQARMAMALARSFITSTRFELNVPFATEMFLRARYLLEQIAGHQGRGWEKFQLTPAILRY